MTLLSLTLLMVCVLCYTVQTFFNKMFAISYPGPTSAATPVFATLYGLICGALTWAYNGFHYSPHSVTFVLGLLCGISLFIFNLAAINAAQSGPYAFQSMMMLFGAILIAVLFSAVVWGEKLSAIQLAGIVVMLIAFVVFNSKGLRFNGVKKHYFLWVILLFFSNGIYGVIVDAQQRLLLHAERNEMIITTFVSSSIISLVYLLIQQKSNAPKAYQMGTKSWCFALGSSIAAAFAINFLMLCLKYIPASILYTVNNGAILILSAILSVIVLREKLEKHMVLGIILAVISIILLS